jgi:hypothetical protein
MQTVWIVTEEFYGIIIRAVFFDKEKAKDRAREVGMHGCYEEYEIEDSEPAIEKQKESGGK